MDDRSLVLFAFRGNAASVACYNAFDNGKADPGSIEFFDSVEPLKDAEQFVSISRIETCTVIFYIVAYF